MFIKNKTMIAGVTRSGPRRSGAMIQARKPPSRRTSVRMMSVVAIPPFCLDFVSGCVGAGIAAGPEIVFS